MNLPRSSGILLHPTSFPSPHGIGSLGIEAYRFLDFLADAGQSVWQILPLNPTGYGDSPYSAFSAFAGNPLLICLERLVEADDLESSDIEGVQMPEGEVHYDFVHGFKGRLLRKAALRFRNALRSERHIDFDRFCFEQAFWLNDFAIFMALREHFKGKGWNLWPADLRHRSESALHFWGETLAEPIYAYKYAQFVFFEQWFALKKYANRHGIRILGDIPIFVAYNSADVWTNRHLFYLNEKDRPSLVAGVPPDYFSKTGQRWGNPLYRWEVMEKEGFSWWQARFSWNLALTDWVRLDHFRGFESCWAIPAKEKTAVNGQWMPVPGEALFRTLAAQNQQIPVIAEDLGVITPEVEALRDRFGFPGMKILHFAFSGDAQNPYLPHNLEPRCVLYTGTHDNNTTVGWWDECSAKQRKVVANYLNTDTPKMPWDLIQLAQGSVAKLCIVPLQDVLSLGTESRMNRPGHPQGNWRWRYKPTDLECATAQSLLKMAKTYGRMPESGH